MFRILIDALSMGYGGAETYIRELLPKLASYPAEIHALLPSESADDLKKTLPSGIRMHAVRRGTANPVARHRYQRHQLPELIRRLGVNIVFVPGGLTGLTNRIGADFRLVTMIQNMLPFDREERRYYRFVHYPKMRIRLWLLYLGMIRTLKRSDRAIFISAHSARTIGSRLNGLDYRVIPHGIPEEFQRAAVDRAEVIQKYDLTRPYLLYVSILDPYKHQDRIIMGFERFMSNGVRKDFELIFAGPVVGRYGREVSRMAAQARYPVRCLGHVPHAYLPGMVRGAEALLFASTCECCPFILLEYLGACRPVICSEKAPMPELVGSGALYVPPLDATAWSRAFERVLCEPEVAEELISGAKARSAELSWEQTAQRTYEALTEW